MNGTQKSQINLIQEDLKAIFDAALAETAEVIHTDLVQSQTMPRDTGALQNESTFVKKVKDGHYIIASSTPYALRLYFHPEYHFGREKNPNAGALWFKPYEAGGDKTDMIQSIFGKLVTQKL